MMTFKEGLATFAQRASLKDLREAATFAHVVPGTVLSWLTGGSPPKGEAQLRMMYYLQLKGLDLSELAALPRPAFVLGMYIATDTLSVEGAMQKLGYATLKDLYRLLHGADLTAARAAVLSRVLEAHRDEAEIALTTLRLKPLSETSDSSPVAEQPLETTQKEPRQPFIVEHVAGSLLTATALVESLILTGDSQNLAATVELVGQKRLADLATYLNDDLLS